jgi:transposase
MRFVALKSEAQLGVQTLHRIRDQLVGERIALMNQIRSVLLERGHVIPQERAKLSTHLSGLLETENDADLTSHMRTLVAEVHERWQHLDRRIATLDTEFAEQARTDVNARQLKAPETVSLHHRQFSRKSGSSAGRFSASRDTVQAQVASYHSSFAAPAWIDPENLMY